MRPTGALHLGNYHGALRNWVELQYQYECFFFVADWHALTTGYEDTAGIPAAIREVLIDWLAAGLNPGVATLFVQSHVPEHAELHLLLSMITPLGWLERVPTYKDQQEQLKDKDLATYGFLGYPLLQSADILLYRAAFVPVGEDQVAHVEITREVARRFNHLYGREPDFEQKAERAIKELGGRNITLYRQLRRRFQETGDEAALERARRWWKATRASRWPIVSGCWDIRVPDHIVPRMLLTELNEPLMSSTLLLPGDEMPLTDGEQIRARLEHQLDAILDGGHCGIEPTTVVDLAVSPPVVVRQGRGILPNPV